MGLFKDCGCGCNGEKQQEKFLISVISGLTFFIVANPETFRLVRRVLGPRIATPTGCPSTMGLLVHTLVFIFVVWGMMNIKKEDYSIEGEMPMMVGPSPEEEKPMVSPPMAEIPEPLPGFSEMQYDAIDSGLELAPLDIMGEEIDKPMTLKVRVQEQTTCQCDNGKTITIR